MKQGLTISDAFDVQRIGFVSLTSTSLRRSKIILTRDHLSAGLYLWVKYLDGAPVARPLRVLDVVGNDSRRRKDFRSIGATLEVKDYKANPLTSKASECQSPCLSAEAYDPFSLAKEVEGFRDDPQGYEPFSPVVGTVIDKGLPIGFPLLYMEIIERGTDSIRKV